MQSKKPLSAIIITLNEEKTIGKCLESVSFCNEVIVVDSGSTDNTVAIATASGAKVFHQEWLGYGPQKQCAVNKAQNDWVLCLDADETISPTLKASINALGLDKETVAGFTMPRRNHFLGKPLNHGEGYPDYSLRLFNRKTGHWSDDQVHEGVEVSGSIQKLSGDIMHFSAESISTYLSKQNKYTQLQAEAMFKRGKRCGPIKCFTSPVLRFIKFYFLRLGILDGLPGFIHISIGCFNAFAKYAKLLELQRTSNQG